MILSFKNIRLISFFILLIFLIALTGMRGIVYSDEGYILQSAQRVLQGQIPYKDFHFVYTPLSIYFTAFSFHLFGESILSGRVLMLALSLTTSYVLFLLLGRLTKNFAAQALGVLIYVTWGPMHTNFPWPVMFALSFGIIACFCMVSAIQDRKPTWLLLAGFCTLLVFLAKQNFGVAILATYFSALFFQSQFRKQTNVYYYLLGLCIPSIIYGGYLFFSGSLPFFFEDFYTYTIRRIVLEQTLSTPFISADSFFQILLKFFLYTFPFFVSIAALFVSFSKKSRYLFLALFVLFFYLLGIRPTTDYIHLSPLLSLTGIPLVMIYADAAKKSLRNIVFFLLSLLVVCGAYTAYSYGFYKWEPSLEKQNSFIFLPKTYVFLDEYHSNELKNLITAVNKQTKEDDPIFVNGYMPMFYFVSGRKNVTEFDLIEPTKFYIPYEKMIVKKLQAEHVPLIITKGEPAENFIGEYIQKEYNKIEKVNGFFLWKKK